MSMQPQHTLYLWIEGMFPRRIVYSLFLKGIVSSATQLRRGETNHSFFRVVPITITEKGFVGGKPDGKSLPCLKVENEKDNTVEWIHESGAILQYLEDLFPDSTRLTPATILQKAQTMDLFLKVDSATANGGFYLKNAAAVTGSWSGLPGEHRSLDIARYCKSLMMNDLRALLEWAGPTLSKTGWLTPGLSRPGMVDVSLIATARYMWISYAWDIFEDESLAPLKRWLGRFKELEWWDELEEDPEHQHPAFLAYSADCREV